MSISIVMLTYNNYEKFVRSVTSMFYFITEPAIKEFIILDNGSYQHELKVFLKSLETQITKFRVIWSNQNLGIAKGRKVLFDVAGGEYIASFDSDIVIVNPPLFLEVFYKALDIPGMMLVGGGGGDHTYFPSLERENIDNKESPETHQELKLVEEVAGWFHGFKSSILTKNGGKVEMDEQFSPFWAEDSDFCMQIRLLGGKCCIMGKGVVAHQWSSCDKKKTQITLEDMWNKFQDKWYNVFGKDFKFEIDSQFYDANYPNSRAMKRNREFYYKIGMIEGHFYSKKPIELLFNNVTFPSLTQVHLEDKNETMSLEDFNNKMFNYDNIINNNFQIVSSTLPKNFETLIIFTVFDMNKCIETVKQLISMQNINIVISLTSGMKHFELENFLKKYSCNYMITKFPNFNFDLIPFIINFKEIVKRNYNFSKVLNISTERDNSEYLTRPIETFQPGYFLQNQLAKLDKFNMSFIDQVVTLNQNMMWNKDCVFYETSDYLNKLFSSFPIMNTLMKCLKIPKKYVNYVSPRCSPKHSLERLMGYLKPKISRDYFTYYVVVCTINDNEDLIKLQDNLNHFIDGEIVIFNKGSMKKINIRELNCDYYFTIDSSVKNETIWLSSLENINISKFTNFVFCENNFEILDPIDNFLERAIFKNICFLEEEGKINLSLFSIIDDNVQNFAQFIQSEDNDIQSYLRKINSKVIWNCKKQETDEETIIEYYKNGEDDGEDIPISFY